MNKLLFLFGLTSIVAFCVACDSLIGKKDIGFIEKSELAWLQNDSIKFSVLSLDHRDSIEKCFVLRISISFKSYKNVKNALRIPPRQWIELLNDENTDWAANLCLYTIRKKDASFYLFNDIRTRKAWVNSDRYKEDLDYWSKIMWEEVERK